MSKGKIYLLASAVIYGIAPTLSIAAYGGGANGITLTFLRAVLSIPILLYILYKNHMTLKLDRKELKQVIVLGVFGGAIPIVLLYLSYDFIPTGIATTLHFIYPLVIALASAFIYHEKVSKIRLIAVILSTMGIFLFVNIERSVSSVGVLFALLSGIFYSFYVIYMSRSGLDTMNYIKLTFYVTLIISLITLVFGAAVHSLNFHMQKSAWLYSLCISMLITLGAIPLFQLGVRYEGALTAGIMSTFEPITSVTAGAVFLGEIFGAAQILGMAMILSGIIMAQKYA